MTGLLALCVVAATQVVVQPPPRSAAPDSLHVRGVSRDTTLALVPAPSGQSVRADVVLPLIGGSMRVTGSGRWSVELPGTSVELTDGVPFAASGSALIPLAAAPSLRDGALLLPLQFFSDLAPRLGNNLMWDADRRELRALRVTVHRAAVTSRPAGAPATNATARASTPSRPVSVAPRLPAPPADASAATRRRSYTVVVDAGHGGPDGGMHGPIGSRFTMREKDVTLAVSKELARELQDRGVHVVMTRTTDTLIALGDRGRIANQQKADLFISIHVNAANPYWKNPGAARGFETYFLGEDKTEDDRRVAQMENEAVRFETGAAGARDDALGFILNDMKQNEHLRESNDLAQVVQARLGQVHPGPSRGVKQAGFRVLVTSFMPSVLVEIGFGTNPAEAAWMSAPDGQQVIATAVADAAMAYFARYERRVGAGGPVAPLP